MMLGLKGLIYLTHLNTYVCKMRYVSDKSNHHHHDQSPLKNDNTNISNSSKVVI